MRLLTKKPLTELNDYMVESTQRVLAGRFPRSRRMTCSKCDGLMLKESVYTLQGSLVVHRCLHCGEVVDPLIISNRG